MLACLYEVRTTILCVYLSIGAREYLPIEMRIVTRQLYYNIVIYKHYKNCRISPT